LKNETMTSFVESKRNCCHLKP